MECDKIRSSQYSARIVIFNCFSTTTDAEVLRQIRNHFFLVKILWLLTKIKIHNAIWRKNESFRNWEYTRENALVYKAKSKQILQFDGKKSNFQKLRVYSWIDFGLHSKIKTNIAIWRKNKVLLDVVVADAVVDAVDDAVDDGDAVKAAD